jgi:hypothetical protein
MVVPISVVIGGAAAHGVARIAFGAARRGRSDCGAKPLI